MRYALISDIHANLHALKAVLADVSRKRVDGIYHLGDLVGYSAYPNEVVALIQEKSIPGIAGNYDSTTATDYKNCGCRAETPRDEELAHVSYEWTLGQVSKETKRYLGGLPFRIDVRALGGHVAGPTLTLVHATPVNNLVYVTEDRTDAFLMKMAQQAGLRPGDAIAFGHTHKPWHRVVEGISFVNTGSVGRPKDGDPRSSYAVVDFGGAEPAIEIMRVAYDVEAAVAALKDAGLPEEFGEVLRTGRTAAVAVH